MIKISFTFPMGCALSLRGVAGRVTLVDQHYGGHATFELNPERTLSGKRLTVPMIDGLPPDLTSTEVYYYDMQVYTTISFQGGNRVVRKNGVYDLKGKKMSMPSFGREQTFGAEMDIKPVAPGPNIWISWTVNKVGNCRVRILGDDETLREKKFTTKQHSKDKLANLRTIRDLKLKIHLIKPDAESTTQDEQIFVGEPVAFGFKLDELQNRKELKIQL